MGVTLKPGETRMPTGALTGARDYFAEVLTPNNVTFFNGASTFQNAINLATSLYHFHEWLYSDFHAELEKELGASFGSKGALWQAVEGKDARFGYIRDVANASKHVRIGGPGKPSPSTGMTHIANTVIVVAAYGQGAYGAGRYGGGASVHFEDRGQLISFDECAAALFRFWNDLLIKLP
jgi:hypothetical protein